MIATYTMVNDVITRLKDLVKRTAPDMTAHEQMEVMLEVKEMAKNNGEEPILFLLRCFQLQEESHARSYLMLQRRVVQQLHGALNLLQIGDRVPEGISCEIPVRSSEVFYQTIFYPPAELDYAPELSGGLPAMTWRPAERRLFRRDREGWSRVE